MQRYFIPPNGWQEKQVMITGDDRHHIARVMRMNAGDSIICSSPEGMSAECEIVEITEHQVTAHVQRWLEESNDLPVSVTIAQGLPKGDKMELVLQKGTELGASAFIPFQAARSIVKWDGKKAEKKQSRYRKIVKEASEQSHRSSIPEVHPLMSVKQLLAASEAYDVKIFAYEDEARSSNYQSLSGILSNAEAGQKIIACIGPEGGYTIEEVNAFKQHGFQTVRLGPRILRTETAPLYLLAGISYHFEELGC
ncbi:16S rRNA (uracil(1498)-N(3))-methyltransferase [Sediminibacillus albus]|uniref:Ribosomal RNA small subunit methyltransferase E n=1 Tax=Sediminibacillus albus TaxID=407036 RepID=A0A1G9CP27_9BACI|nr:16S rRNA (uracil(1498)-N(3))-methyltransferase [Sediminibacillus albus]SDK53357.1 16S rRNA (uracil1498-N3)-methyltransferase [Sediminibacillus albus]